MIAHIHGTPGEPTMFHHLLPELEMASAMDPWTRETIFAHKKMETEK
jgi:hypothetical protein